MAVILFAVFALFLILVYPGVVSAFIIMGGVVWLIIAGTVRDARQQR